MTPSFPAFRWAAVVVALSLAVVACGDAGPTQGDAAVSVTDEVIVPAFVDAGAATAALDNQATSFCSDAATGDLDALQSAWSDARQAWRRTDTMSFGPRGMSRSVSVIDPMSIDTAAVDALLTGGDIPDTAAVASTLSAKVRGLGALEHLLFSVDPTTPGWCDLLRAYTESIATATASIVTEWTDGTDGDAPYRNVFAGETGTMDGRGAAKEMVEDIVFALRAMSTFGVGRAMGVTSPDPDPNAVTEGAAGTAADDLTATIEGIAAMYHGGDSEVGLSTLVAPRSEEVDTAITDLLAEIPTLFDAVGSPLRTNLLDHPNEATALLAALDQLRIHFEVDVVSLLDITIGFSDTDGDT